MTYKIAYFFSALALSFLHFFSPVQVRAQNVPQQNKSTDGSQQFRIGIEFRPRTEVRNGYRSMPADTSQVSFFTSHRARINLDYKRKFFLFHSSIQNVRIWGDTNPRSTAGELQFYEFYVEPEFNEKLSIRVGRQKIKYDNQRLFAENDWRQAGGKRDAVRVMYRGTKFDADFIGAYNQTDAGLFGTTFNVPWDIYRTLLANFIKYNINQRLTITAINFADEYTDPATGNKTGHWKLTNGGRIEYQKNKIYITFAGYYQWGRIENGKNHHAYYLEPEIKWSPSEKYTSRLGAQIISGDNDKRDEISSAFLAQYGAFHRHNGRMDYTQLTVRTNEHEGIVNPYLIQDLKISKKSRITWESHILGTQKKLTVDQGDGIVTLPKLYAWENDFRFRHKPNSFTEIELAYMFLIPGETIKYLPTGRASDNLNFAQFAYLVVTWTPELLNWEK